MVKVLSDSTCDLSKELTERYNIDIIPLHVYLGSEERRDSVDVTPEEIFAWSDANHTTPKTSAPSSEDVIELYKKNLDEYEQLVVFTISSSMSASYNVCRLAAEEIGEEDRITVIDSANLSTGVGHLVIEAAIMASQGKNMKEIEEAILELRGRVRSSFTIDTLTFLHRGGRCSSIAAFFGSALKLHPRIVVENGAMRSDKKYRGSLERVIMKYTEDLRELLKKAKPDRVFITHSCGPEIVNKVKDFLKSLNIFKEILDTKAGAVISAHCGPGTLGVLYIENP